MKDGNIGAIVTVSHEYQAVIHLEGFPFDAVIWHQKTGKYGAVGARHPLRDKEMQILCDVTQDAVSEWGAGQIKLSAMRLKKEEIAMVEWRHRTLNTLSTVTYLQTGICGGMLDTQYRGWEQATSEVLKYRLPILRKSNDAYLKNLLKGFRKGAFGPSFEFNQFLERVELLLRREIDSFSPYHQAAKYALETFHAKEVK
jgi:hypothetical protein